MSARLSISALIAAALVSPALGQDIPVPQKRPSAGAISPPQAQDKPVTPVKPVEAPPPSQAAPPPQAPPAQQPAMETAAPRPDPALRRAACPALLSGAVTGEPAPPLSQGDCGTESPVAITAIGPVKLGAPATMTCGMATALAALMPEAIKAAGDILGSPLVALEAGAGYECRNRNGDGSGKLSQHAFANALDIAAFKLADGRSIAVGADWPHLPTSGDAAKPAETGSDAEASDSAERQVDQESPSVIAPQQRATTPQARFLVSVHRSACSLFSTVLGPDANAAHRDHFHFDLGCHGKDCKYVICE